MRFYFSKLNYGIIKIKGHKENKQKIINNIIKYNSPWCGHDTYISNTDWTCNTINWFDKFFSIKDKEKYLNFLKKRFKRNDIVINNCWFNQYYPYEMSNHTWHDHKDCDLTNIYFVELWDKSLRTKLIDPYNGKVIIPRVKEGDLLIFPSNIVHSSPINHTKNRKTVISFNVSFLS